MFSTRKCVPANWLSQQAQLSASNRSWLWWWRKDCASWETIPGGWIKTSRRSVWKVWAIDLKRSGYPTTFQHQVIKVSVKEWENMCKDEDDGVRLIHRVRTWLLCSWRMEKEGRRESWYKTDSSPTSITAPLIISPTAGDPLPKSERCVTRPPNPQTLG